MFYIRFFLVTFWFLFASFLVLILGLLKPIIFWRMTDLNQDYARLFAWGALKILGIRVQIEGDFYIESEKPAIYVANHQSGLDIATFGEFFPKQTVIIGKKEIAWIPVFGWIYFLAGNVFIDRKKTTRAVAGLLEVVEAIKRKRVSVWMFPEGTRNSSGQGLLAFKKGAFHAAVQAQVPIVPLVQSPLIRLVSWKERRIVSGVIRIRVLPPIPTVGLLPGQVEGLAEETRKKMLVALDSLGLSSI
jgi:1-acyl-sn-glycerol-3-phosphate acyltransferase